MHVETAHDAVERHRNDEALDRERHQRGDEKQRLALDEGLPPDRQRERDRLQREHVDRRGDAVLVEQHEAQHQHAAGKEMGDVEP